MKHPFTPVIESILERHFGTAAAELLELSQLLEYINIKTRSASRGSKSRSSFANLYAIFVLVEDYIAGGFNYAGDYSAYDGAIFTRLLRRQRELPFGSKLQNHALNSRLNDEFKKYFPTSEYLPIIRDVESSRYWINQHLLRPSIGGTVYNLAAAVIDIINAYIDSKRDAFESFIKTCRELTTINQENPYHIQGFITELLAPNVDARLFEIDGHLSDVLNEIVVQSMLEFNYPEEQDSDEIEIGPEDDE